MLIEFRCGNYSRFDKNSGQYVVCGQKMSASTDDAGLIVNCPRCNQECEVPHEETSAAPAKQTRTAAKPKVKTQRCPKCGGTLDQRGVCGECRWVRPRFAKAKQSLDEMEMEPAGMMLWFSQIMSEGCLLYTSPSPRDGLLSRMPSSA